MSFLRVVVLLTASIALVAGGSSWCQPYPVKPVRLIIGGLPGTAPDVIARVIGSRMFPNRWGSRSSSTIAAAGPASSAAQLVAAAPADGYTALLVGGGGVSIVPFLTKKRPYDPVRDFTPVTLVTIAPLVMACHPSLPVKSVKELIGLAKAETQGASFRHTRRRLDPPSHVRDVQPRRRHHHGARSLQGRAAGGDRHDQRPGALVITTVIPVLPHVKAARCERLPSPARSARPCFPTSPPSRSPALPGFESLQWFAMFAPRNTPGPIRERLFKEVRKAVENPAVTSVLAQEGQELAVNGPQALAEFHRTEIAKWQKIIVQLRESGIVLE